MTRSLEKHRHLLVPCGNSASFRSQDNSPICSVGQSCSLSQRKIAACSLFNPRLLGSGQLPTAPGRCQVLVQQASQIYARSCTCLVACAWSLHICFGSKVYNAVMFNSVVDPASSLYQKKAVLEIETSCGCNRHSLVLLYAGQSFSHGCMLHQRAMFAWPTLRTCWAKVGPSQGFVKPMLGLF